jgi:hypothetical protein
MRAFGVSTIDLLARSNFGRFRDSTARLHLQTLFVGAIAGLDGAWVFIGLRSLKVVVVEVRVTGHQVKAHILAIDPFIRSRKDARWVKV